MSLLHVHLPDYESRQRLFDLYGKGLTLKLERQAQLLTQTEGVSATFIRELLRKAALFSADEHLTEDTEELVVEDRHLDQALRELALEGGELTKRLLGASRAF